MKKKRYYESPEVDIIDVEAMQPILTGSVLVEESYADEYEGGL